MKNFFTQILKSACIVSVLAAAATPVMAGEPSVVVLTKDGSSYSVPLTDVKRIGLGGDGVEISRTGGTTASYAYADINRILIGADAAGITDITSEGNIAVWPTIAHETIHIAGAEPGTPISVYALNGALVASAVATEGTTAVGISAAPDGVCIVSVGSKTVKIIKK